MKILDRIRLVMAYRQNKYGMECHKANMYRMAEYLFRSAAKRGQIVARFNLGLMCYWGEAAIDKSETERLCEAVYWYRLSAEDGHTNAQCNLGLMYFKGEGVQDKREDYIKRESYIWLFIGEKNKGQEADGEIIRRVSELAKEAYKILKETPWEELLTPEGKKDAEQEAERRFEKIQERKHKK